MGGPSRPVVVLRGLGMGSLGARSRTGVLGLEGRRRVVSWEGHAREDVALGCVVLATRGRLVVAAAPGRCLLVLFHGGGPGRQRLARLDKMCVLEVGLLVANSQWPGRVVDLWPRIDFLWIARLGGY